MTSAENVARALGKARRVDKGWQACCPCHDDKTPSLSITDAGGGKILVYCHAGCTQEAVIEELKRQELWSAAPKPERTGEPQPPSKPNFEQLLGFAPSAIYEYQGLSGETLGYVARLDRETGQKEFRPVTLQRNGSGARRWKAAGFERPYPLLRHGALAKRPSAKVLIVEGEKTAVAARSLFPDFVVLTWPGGAKAVQFVNWPVLQDRDVTFWPDADKPGFAAANIAAGRLNGLARVKIVKLPDNLPEGWDLADDIPQQVDVHLLLTHAAEVDDTLASFAKTPKEIAAMDLPPRSYIVEPFLPTDGLAMLYSWRGIGKTWVALVLALAIARGEKFLVYGVPQPRRVLIIEGEMTLSALRDRLLCLGATDDENLMIIPSELLFRSGRALNINEEADQELLLRTLAKLEGQGRRPSLIILDNLSSLGGGIDENDNSALEKQLKFFVHLRHQGYAVLLIHHAGKSGEQRGASRREDLLDTSIRLVVPKETGSFAAEGARFELEFMKTRGERPQPDKIQLFLKPGEDGLLRFEFSPAVNARPAHRALKLIFDGIPGQKSWTPYPNQAALVETMGVVKGTVSKMMTELRKRNLVGTLQGGGLSITQKGVEILSRLHPSLSGGPPEHRILQVHYKNEGDDEPF